MIQIKNLSKKYGSNLILKDINLSFEDGKVYGVVGENGSGKTTFFKCITAIEEYEGEIISNLNPLKDHIGYLQTEPFFFSKITGEEYLQLFCNARKIKLEQVEQKNIFNLPLNQYASTYSTGMKKKLALMAILLQQNQYYILDEPFNGVDIQSNLLINDILIELKQLGKTILISSHVFSTLQDICDEIHLLKNGHFERKVEKHEFNSLEQEMRALYVGNEIKKLGLK